MTPIPINRTPITSDSPTLPQDGTGSLRDRVEQQVDAIAGSVNKVISGVVGSSFGVLRLLVYESDHGAEWTDIWASITTGKVCTAYHVLDRKCE